MTVFKGTRYLIPVREGIYRNKLKPVEQAIYDKMFYGVMDMKPEVSVSFPDSASLQNICDAFRVDQPWFWYVDGISALIGRSSKVQFTYRMSTEAVTRMNLTIEEKVRHMIERRKTFGVRRSPYEDVDYIHDILAKECTYRETGWRAHCIIGALIDHQAVCQGISYAFKVILNAMKIGCITCMGASKKSGGGHSWNMVLLNGSHYYVDVTSDLRDKDGYISHQFALMDERTCNHYYCIDQNFKTGIPGESNNWFRRNGLYCETSQELKSLCRKKRGKVFECELGYAPLNPKSYLTQVIGEAIGNISYRWSFDKGTGYLFLDLSSA